MGGARRFLPSGGGATDEYLREGDLGSYFEGTERPAFVLTNSGGGVVHVTEGEQQVVEPGPDCAAVAAITDERILFVVGGAEGGDRDVSIPYADVRGIETESGILKNELRVTVRPGDRYEMPVGSGADLAAVASFVERAIDCWVAVEGRLSEAKNRLSTVEERLEDGDPAAAAEAHREATRLRKEAREVATAFRDGEHAMVRRIDQLETRLRITEIRGHRVRSQQLRQEGDEARENEAYRAALSAYRRARDQCDRALALAADGEYHEADAIRAESERIDRAIDALRADPLNEARAACERAATAEGASAVEAWREALETCHDVHALLHRHGETLSGDPATLQVGVEWAASNLRRAHRERAAAAETRGDDCREDDPAAAREAYQQARDHRRAARAVAAEFAGGSPGPDDAALARLAEKREALSADGQ